MTLGIDGFGDEVVYVGSLLFCLLAAFLVYVSTNNHLLHEFEVLISRVVGHFPGATPSSSSAVRAESDDATFDDSSAGPGARPTINRAVYNADSCPICLNVCQYAALANCGHVYCCQCIISYWRFGTWLSAVDCPVCRTKITLLMPNFSEADVEVSERRRASAEIRSYNRRFSDQPRPLMDYVRDIPVLVPSLFNQLFTLSGLMLMFRLRVLLLLVAAFLYIVSPLDLLPEAFLGLFGLLDDLFVGFVLLIYLCMAYRQFLRT